MTAAERRPQARRAAYAGVIDERMERARLRDRVAEERERLADERDGLADEREWLADARERDADEHDRRVLRGAARLIHRFSLDPPA
jgi:hypothetical protein